MSLQDYRGGARYGRLIKVFNWMGNVCFIVAVIFAIRNYFVSALATGQEKGIITFLSKLIGRSIG